MPSVNKQNKIKRKNKPDRSSKISRPIEKPTKNPPSQHKKKWSKEEMNNLSDMLKNNPSLTKQDVALKYLEDFPGERTQRSVLRKLSGLNRTNRPIPPLVASAPVLSNLSPVSTPVLSPLSSPDSVQAPLLELPSPAISISQPESVDSTNNLSSQSSNSSEMDISSLVEDEQDVNSNIPSIEDIQQFNSNIVPVEEEEEEEEDHQPSSAIVPANESQWSLNLNPWNQERDSNLSSSPSYNIPSPQEGFESPSYYSSPRMGSESPDYSPIRPESYRAFRYSTSPSSMQYSGNEDRSNLVAIPDSLRDYIISRNTSQVDQRQTQPIEVTMKIYPDTGNIQCNVNGNYQQKAISFEYTVNQTSINDPKGGLNITFPVNREEDPSKNRNSNVEVKDLSAEKFNLNFK